MDMDHAEALEHIEIAAAEPDGLERLMAGDTPEAAAIAGHLAGCPACVAELAQVRQLAGVVREVVVDEPDPELKERTLAFIRTTGVDRSGLGAASGQAPAVGEPVQIPVAEPVQIPVAEPLAGPVPAPQAASGAAASAAGAGAAIPIRRRRSPLAAIAAIAAALFLVGVVGFSAGGGFGTGEDYESEIAVLVNTTTTAMSLAGQPDTQVVALTATPAGGTASGSLVFSPSSGELVMLARGLSAPAAGAEYGCWVEANGERRRIGTMYPAADGWAWSGTAPGIASLPPDTTFGVSLVPANGAPGEPVMVGSL
jgi:hypothetical protein